MDKPAQITYKDVILSNLPKEIKDVIKDLAGKKNRSDMQWWYCAKKLPCELRSGHFVLDVKFRRDGRLLALSSVAEKEDWQDQVQVFDVEQEYRCVCKIPSIADISGIYFGPADTVLFSAPMIDTEMYSLHDKSDEPINCNKYWPSQKYFSSDATILCSTYSQTLYIRKFIENRRDALQYDAKIYHVGLCPRDNFIVLFLENYHMHIIDSNVYEEIFFKKYHNLPCMFCFSRCGKFLAVMMPVKGEGVYDFAEVYNLYTVDIFALKKATIKTRLKIKLNDRFRKIEYSPCGSFFAVATDSGVEFIDSISGKNIGYLSQQTYSSISFHPCGELAIGSDGTVFIFAQYKIPTLEQKYLKNLLSDWLCIEKPPKSIASYEALFTDVAVKYGIERAELDQLWQTLPCAVQTGTLIRMLDLIQLYGKEKNAHEF